MEILNHKIVDFNLIRIRAEVQILDNLYEQGIDFETIKLSSKHYKTLFINYYIKEILYFSLNSNRKPFYIISKPKTSEFYDYIDSDKYQKAFATNISKITSILPLLHYTDTNNTYTDIIDSKENELNEWFSNQIINQKDRLSKKSFKSIKKTLDYYNLSYLNAKIFEELRYKLIF